ncbi:hypothetical protein [Bacillus sp. FJAT-52991]|uniref:Uncharacterized protein n=1 Tax=Bacillus kandeliae TaxID=3129297 RepID=A0ABZ2NA90_9BACI
MAYYIVFMIQLMIWSFYSLARWLSKGDSSEFHWLLFLIFFYLCVIVAQRLLGRKRSYIITVIILLFYFSLRWMMSLFIQ